MLKHSFTVADVYEGIGISITVTAEDRPKHFPASITGENLADRKTAAGKAANQTARNQLPVILEAIQHAAFNAACIDGKARRDAEQERTATAVTAAVETAQAEADTRLQQAIKDATAPFEARLLEMAENLDKATRERNAAEHARAEAVANAQAQATAKRRAAALKGLKAKKAVRK